MFGYRWVSASPGQDDFLPLSVQKEPPPRILDDTDKHCMSFGLSFFLTFEGAIQKFQRERARKSNFLKGKSGYIAQVKIEPSDGIGSAPQPFNFGHFTFHEYEGTDFSGKIAQIKQIDNNDGTPD